MDQFLGFLFLLFFYLYFNLCSSVELNEVKNASDFLKNISAKERKALHKKVWENDVKHCSTKEHGWKCQPECFYHTKEECVRPDNNTSCFGININYSYVKLSEEFPAHLEKLFRPTPLCWSYLRLLLCASYYRPCAKGKIYPEERTLAMTGGRIDLEIAQSFRYNLCEKAKGECSRMTDNLFDKHVPDWVHCQKEINETLFSKTCKFEYQGFTTENMSSANCLTPTVYVDQNVTNGRQPWENVHCVLKCHDNPLSEQYLQCALIFCLLCLLFFSVIILYLFQLFKTKSYNHAITISVLSILIYFLIWCISIFLRLNNLSTLCKYDGNGVQYRATDRFCKLQSFFLYFFFVHSLCFLIDIISPITGAEMFFFSNLSKKYSGTKLMAITSYSLTATIISTILISNNEDGYYGLCHYGVDNKWSGVLLILPALLFFLFTILCAFITLWKTTREDPKNVLLQDFKDGQPVANANDNNANTDNNKKSFWYHLQLMVVLEKYLHFIYLCIEVIVWIVFEFVLFLYKVNQTEDEVRIAREAVNYFTENFTQHENDYLIIFARSLVLPALPYLFLLTHLTKRWLKMRRQLKRKNQILRPKVKRNENTVSDADNTSIGTVEIPVRYAFSQPGTKKREIKRQKKGGSDSQECRRLHIRKGNPPKLKKQSSNLMTQPILVANGQSYSDPVTAQNFYKNYVFSNHLNYTERQMLQYHQQNQDNQPVYLDPQNPQHQLMLQYHQNSQDQQAYNNPQPQLAIENHQLDNNPVKPKHRNLRPQTSEGHGSESVFSSKEEYSDANDSEDADEDEIKQEEAFRQTRQFPGPSHQNPTASHSDANDSEDANEDEINEEKKFRQAHEIPTNPSESSVRCSARPSVNHTQIAERPSEIKDNSTVKSDSDVNYSEYENPDEINEENFYKQTRQFR